MKKRKRCTGDDCSCRIPDEQLIHYRHEHRCEFCKHRVYEKHDGTVRGSHHPEGFVCYGCRAWSP